MPLVNRDKDVSEQTIDFTCSLGTVTGQTYAVCVVPWPAQLISAQIAGIGLSGAPNVSLWLQRFVIGSGATSTVIGQSMVLTTYGTSGAMGFTVLNGLTNLLQAGDVISLSQAAANTATVDSAVTVCLKALQDIKSHFGV